MNLNGSRLTVATRWENPAVGSASLSMQNSPPTRLEDSPTSPARGEVLPCGRLQSLLYRPSGRCLYLPPCRGGRPGFAGRVGGELHLSEGNASRAGGHSE